VITTWATSFGSRVPSASEPVQAKGADGLPAFSATVYIAPGRIWLGRLSVRRTDWASDGP
jgi:hypothetical protein